MKRIIIFILFAGIVSLTPVRAQLQIALLKYNGGGDWYANPTSLPNLIKFCNQNLGTQLEEDYATVEVSSPDIFNYPFVHMTGHGNVVFSAREVKNLREYLVSGGFLHIDDNYGMDLFVRREMKKVFPELEFVEIPWSHTIYHKPYDFNKGLPKIHEHDNKEAKGYGLFWNGRMFCFYTQESDLGDGWESPEVHKDAPEIREKALKMGANIIRYCFMGEANDQE